MELETLFDLPAHPLVVHAAVVLLPLAALGVIVSAAVPRWRRSYAPVALGLALVATISVGLAQGSGEALQEHVKETRLVEEHTERAEQVLPWAIGLAVVAVAVVAAEQLARRGRGPAARTVTAVLVVAGLVTGIGATYAVIDVGHSGAKATWSEVDMSGGEGASGEKSGEPGDQGRGGEDRGGDQDSDGD